MATKLSLFNNYKQCDICKRPLPDDYVGDTCPSCMETKLFQEVKDYIRSNDVNEYQVAEHFNIPQRQVKAWIREGRIEYKQTNPTGAITMHCQHCGAPVSFGTLCPKCLKLINGNKGFKVSKPSSDSDNKMRYLDN